LEASAADEAELKRLLAIVGAEAAPELFIEPLWFASSSMIRRSSTKRR
jgi:hypothetical protein